MPVLSLPKPISTIPILETLDTPYLGTSIYIYIYVTLRVASQSHLQGPEPEPIFRGVAILCVLLGESKPGSSWSSCTLSSLPRGSVEQLVAEFRDLDYVTLPWFRNPTTW